MFCTQCGSNIPDGSRFCHVCGTEQIRPNANLQSLQQEQQVGATQPYAGYNDMNPQVYEDNTQFVELKKPTGVDLNDKKQYASKSGNKGLIIGISIIATLIVAVAIVLIVLNPFKKNDKDKASETKTDGVAVDIENSTAVGNDDSNDEESSGTAGTTTVHNTVAITENTTESEIKKDNGGSFGVVNGILTVDNSLFGMSYAELNSYFNNTLPATEYWEWSDVPLDYLNYVYSDGNNYVLYFENNTLVAVRYGYEISENVIPDNLLNDAISKFGDYDMYWYYEDTLQNFEYDWDYKIKSRTGEYAIFLNPYDGLYHLEQQYTSADYSGEAIQTH